MKKERYLTTNQGVPISDNQNSQTIGERGPVLLQDVLFIEKLAHFDRERIPERVVHAKGAGAYGYFQVYRNMKTYTKAKFLQNPKEKIPVFVRFSTVTGGRGSADTVRDPRGFAVKFYTGDGNYDLVGNNLPVFFIRDAVKFPDMVHAFKGAPDNNIPSASSAHNRFWDFISLTPEATHMIVWLFSDRGTPKSYRMMEGFGVNTYMWVNAGGKAVYVKYHWKPKLGVHNLDRHEAARLAGLDPDYLIRDLWETIAGGGEVEYEICVQLMDIAEEFKQDFDPLDSTKTWPEKKFPLMPVGKMALNRNPGNFFAEVEQAAFCPASIVPGIEFSADKLLQGRTFSYADTQRHRLGANYLQIHVNRPLVPVNNNQRDGAMQSGEFSGPVNYEPNSLGGGMPKEDPMGVPPIYRVEGEVTRSKISLTNDFQQAGEKYRSLGKMDRGHLVDNFTADLMRIDKAIQKRVIENLVKADPELGGSVAEGLKL
ncbi:MAG: catalase [Syntrophaceae bacterium CG2_30_49_12]|nr:MAG: catalase [Syntrophaceae bacterium CG2_30_49_12]PIP05074.1 MAG: catalase [Syntrophobacterales bacterium CG23_combo_of_CG06-09_8_20_14_all_48_27]PJA49091.1 MAG: catalase [Syntrophobacterales bacterium CG_4_9_14_3_um_filter_49_8]